MSWSCVIPLVSLPCPLLMLIPHIAWLEVPRPPRPCPLPGLPLWPHLHGCIHPLPQPPPHCSCLSSTRELSSSLSFDLANSNSRPSDETSSPLLVFELCGRGGCYCWYLSSVGGGAATAGIWALWEVGCYCWYLSSVGGGAATAGIWALWEVGLVWLCVDPKNVDIERDIFYILYLFWTVILT